MHWYLLQEMHFLVILCTELLRLSQLEPLNLETLFELCRVGLIKDTYAMYFTFSPSILYFVFSPSFSLSLSVYFLSHSISLLHSIFSPLICIYIHTHSCSLFFPFIFPSFTLLSFLL